MQPGQCGCNSTPLHMRQDNTAHAQPPILAAATRAVAQVLPEMMSSPVFRTWGYCGGSHGRRRQDSGPACGAFSCCSCSGTKLRVRWPDSMRASALPSGIFCGTAAKQHYARFGASP
eukprot:14330869-Alexandrium_andersonii.AAC.1